MKLPFKAALVNLRERLRFGREGLRDTSRALRWNSRVDSAFSAADARSLPAQLTKDYHRVEKGLTLDSPRQPFGAEVASRLQRGLQALPVESLLSTQAFSALEALRIWNENGEIADEIAPRYEHIAEMVRPPALEWFGTRHSVRDFDPHSPVSVKDISDAVTIASASTPSVCNRQAWKAHAAVDPAIVREVLSHQNGNAGFRDSVPCVVVITASRRWFTGAGERNQHLIDGSLFAMTLSWVLHARGLSSCMLNWSMMNHQSDALRDRICAAEDEEIIMMMAVGRRAATARVARSPRRAGEEVFRLLSQ